MKKLFILLFLILTAGILFAGTPHAVYIELYDEGGNHPDSATFQAWIVGRESEVLTETSGGCTYYDSGTYKGLAQIQCGSFPTQWQPRDVLYVVVTTTLGYGTGEFILNTQSYQGFGPIFGNGTEGIIVGTLSSDPAVLENIKEVTNLTAAYPNPFNPETTIKFSVKEGETATLTIYNLKNQVVLRKTFEAGEHDYTFDGANLTSGIYFYRLQSPSYSSVKKMTMIK